MGKTRLDLDQISGIDNLSLEEYLVRMKENNSKIIVFVLPKKVQSGVQRTEIRFPFKGIIEQVYASCSIPGDQETIIAIEKCSQESIDNNNNGDWTNILSSNLIVEQDQRSSSKSLSQAVISIDNVDINDHFRINIINSGGLEDLTIEVKISI